MTTYFFSHCLTICLFLVILIFFPLLSVCLSLPALKLFSLLVYLYLSFHSNKLGSHKLKKQEKKTTTKKKTKQNNNTKGERKRQQQNNKNRLDWQHFKIRRRHQTNTHIFFSSQIIQALFHFNSFHFIENANLFLC